MKFFMIVPYYIYWHYTQGIAELSRNLFNFLIFEFHFFSVKELFSTLFSPFQRLKENYGNHFVDFERVISTFVVNIIMRIIGFFVRSFILLIAFASILVSVILIPIIVIIWLVIPVLLLLLMIGSIWGYIKYK